MTEELYDILYEEAITLAKEDGIFYEYDEQALENFIDNYIERKISDA